jgi:hypothetical protein
MTVKELIEQLKEYPETMRVVTVLDYREESYLGIDYLYNVNVVERNPDEYEQAYEGEEYHTIRVVCIS